MKDIIYVFLEHNPHVIEFKTSNLNSNHMFNEEKSYKSNNFFRRLILIKYRCKRYKKYKRCININEWFIYIS
jgi:hypothetical protein